jgi:hypothetical protein
LRFCLFFVPESDSLYESVNTETLYSDYLNGKPDWVQELPIELLNLYSFPLEKQIEILIDYLGEDISEVSIYAEGNI